MKKVGLVVVLLAVLAGCSGSFTVPRYDSAGQKMAENYVLQNEETVNDTEVVVNSPLNYIPIKASNCRLQTGSGIKLVVYKSPQEPNVELRIDWLEDKKVPDDETTYQIVGLLVGLGIHIGGWIISENEGFQVNIPWRYDVVRQAEVTLNTNKGDFKFTFVSPYDFPEPEGEGEVPAEGEGEPTCEGEIPVEGEGEIPVEGEGEPVACGEGPVTITHEVVPDVRNFNPDRPVVATYRLYGKVGGINTANYVVMNYVQGEDSLWYSKSNATDLRGIDGNCQWFVDVATNQYDTALLQVVSYLITVGTQVPACSAGCVGMPNIPSAVAYVISDFGIPSEGEPPVEGEGEVPAEGEGEVPAEGEGEPPVEGEGEIPVEGEGEPVACGEGPVTITHEVVPDVRNFNPDRPVVATYRLYGKVGGINTANYVVMNYVQGEDSLWYSKSNATDLRGIDGNCQWFVDVATNQYDTALLQVVSYLITVGTQVPACSAGCVGMPNIPSAVAYVISDFGIPSEGEPPVEGEGEVPAEGEGEVPAEGEGEPPVEGEGEVDCVPSPGNPGIEITDIPDIREFNHLQPIESTYMVGGPVTGVDANDVWVLVFLRGGDTLYYPKVESSTKIAVGCDYLFYGACANDRNDSSAKGVLVVLVARNGGPIPDFTLGTPEVPTLPGEIDRDEVAFAPAKNVELVDVPLFGKGTQVTGYVEGINANEHEEYAILVREKHGTEWQTMPSCEQPLTPIEQNLSWSCQISPDAEEVAAYLVYSDFQVDQCVSYENEKALIAKDAPIIPDTLDVAWRQRIPHISFQSFPAWELTGNVVIKVTDYDPTLWRVNVYFKVLQEGKPAAWFSKPQYEAPLIQPDASGLCSVWLAEEDIKTTEIVAFLVYEGTTVVVCGDVPELTQVCLERPIIPDSPANAWVNRGIGIDTSAPVITLLGDNPLTWILGTPYTDPGATALDDVDGAVAVLIDTSGVNVGVVGTYSVGFTATDSSGNTGTATRTVNVVQGCEAPIIRFSDIPLLDDGEFGTLTGQACLGDSVAIYIKMPDGYWWLVTDLTVSVDPDGSWSFELLDSRATEILAFLMPEGVNPDLCEPCDQIPDLEQALASVWVSRLPAFEITYVAPYGSLDPGNIDGTLSNAVPGNYAVVVYVYVEGNWWPKPLFGVPGSLTPINEDGTWTCWFVTGGLDHNATKIAVFLVPSDITEEELPCSTGSCPGPALPPVERAIDTIIIDR